MAENNEINSIANIEFTTDKEGNVKVKGKQSIYSASFYFDDFYDEAIITKFIKKTEKLIRESFEYHNYIKTIMTAFPELNNDNINSNMTNLDVDIELHHYPLNLFQIVETVMNYHVIHGDRFTSFSLALEILQLHYQNKIGLVPLDKTNHELAHNYSIFLSSKQIFGNWKEFIKQYAEGLTSDAKATIQKVEELTENQQASDFLGIYR